jgi:hypothetical protein
MLEHKDIWYITWHTLVTFTTSSIVYTLQALSSGSIAVTNSIRIDILITVTRKAHPNWSKPSCWVSIVTITAQVTPWSWHSPNTHLQIQCLTTVSMSHLEYYSVLHKQAPSTQSSLIYTPRSVCWDVVPCNLVRTYQYSGGLSALFYHSTQYHIIENIVLQTYIPISFYNTHEPECRNINKKDLKLHVSAVCKCVAGSHLWTTEYNTMAQKRRLNTAIITCHKIIQPYKYPWLELKRGEWVKCCYANRKSNWIFTSSTLHYCVTVHTVCIREMRNG